MNSTFRNRAIRIWLIEDNPGDVRLTKEAFKELDIKVDLHVVNDGEDALLEITNNNISIDPMPDLILLDLNIPKNDGKEVLKALKSKSEWKKIPVIVLSTSTSAVDIHQCYDLFANGFIAKPVEFEDYYLVAKHIHEFWMQTAILPIQN
jgi:two-component system, chemotaxis family, response regulator Rcp1